MKPRYNCRQIDQQGQTEQVSNVDAALGGHQCAIFDRVHEMPYKLIKD